MRFPISAKTVLRVLLKSAKVSDASRQGKRYTPKTFGGELETETVLRVLLKSAKVSDASSQGKRYTQKPFGGELETETVLRVLLKRKRQKNLCAELSVI